MDKVELRPVSTIVRRKPINRERIAVNDLTGPSELAALANNPAVMLDVTQFDLGRLPEHVKAELFTDATSFNAPQLQTSKNIYAGSATSFNAPQLQTSKDIYASSATSFSARQLQTSGHIYANSAIQRAAASDLEIHLCPRKETAGWN
jgi:hypothetical protein